MVLFTLQIDLAITITIVVVVPVVHDLQNNGIGVGLNGILKSQGAKGGGGREGVKL